MSLLCLFGLVATSCARSDSLGPEEAIEVLVLDGVDRARANCIVNNLNGQLSLEKITGLDVDLDATELATLSSVSSICAPALGSTGGLTNSSGQLLDDETVAILLGEDPVADVDVQDAVYRMVDDGLDPALANCLVIDLSALEDPSAVLDDDIALASSITDCRESTGVFE